MNRPAGVTISAVVLIVGSVLTLLVGLVAPFTYLLSPTETPEPPSSKAASIFVAVLFCLSGIWGLLTALDLFRMRRRARISVLIISALLMLFCALSLILIFLAPRFVPELETSPDLVVRVVVAIYALPMLISSWWLLYFNRGTVMSAFLQGFVPASGRRRPLSIVVIAWHAIAFGVLTAPCALSNWPAFLFGTVLTGWAAKFVYFGFGAVEIGIGIGLLKLKAWGHKAAVWFCVFEIVLNTYSAFLPDKAARIDQALESYPEYRAHPPVPLDFVYWSIVIFTWVTFGTALWYLLTRKQAFLEVAKAARANDTGATAMPAP